MIDILIDNMLFVLLITLGGVLISLGVHFVPVGGAPAAMAQATGVGTGTVQLAAGAGLTGLASAGAILPLIANLHLPFIHSLLLVLASGTVGAMIMIAATMLVGTWVYSYGVGCPPASAKVKYDPITNNRQDIFVSQGTQGHGIPTVCFVSGIIGGGLGGLGGAMMYYAMIKIPHILLPEHVALASIFSIGIFFVNAVIAAYNIGGTIEGFHDPKFKRVPRAIVSSLIVTFLCGLMAIITIGGI